MVWSFVARRKTVSGLEVRFETCWHSTKKGNHGIGRAVEADASDSSAAAAAAGRLKREYRRRRLDWHCL